MTQDADRRWAGSMPEAYARYLEPVIFRPFSIDMARRVAAVKHGRVLELAAGTGSLTRELCAALPEAHIVATDLNAPMVEFGSRHAPAEWQQADATQLPFDAGTFDVVVCQFGVMFFPDKRAAFNEARRVLSPSGALLFSTWDRVASHDFASALVGALSRAFPDDPPTFVASVPHGYAEPAVVESDVRAAGFASARVDTISLVSPPAYAAAVAEGFCTGSPLRAAVEARADLQTATATVAKEMQAQLGSKPVTGRMTAHIVQAGNRRD